MNAGVRLLDRDLTFVPIAKCGSSSVLKTIWESKIPQENEIWCDQVKTDAVVMLREPSLRAWSGYNMMSTRSESANFSDPDKPYYPDITLAWDEWLDVLVRNRFHQVMTATLIPQSEYLCSPVSYEFVAWDFKALGERLGFEFPRINQMKVPLPMPDITPEMQRNLRILYGADYQLWELTA